MQAVTITQISALELESLIEGSIKKILSGQKQDIQKNDADELLTVEDTAKFLHLSVPTIYGLIHRGQLPVMKRSKRCYFSKKELIEYLKQGRRKTVSELDAEINDERDAYLLTKKKKG